MSKSLKNFAKVGNKITKNEPVLTLFENIDFDVLYRLISCEETPEDIRAQLKLYAKMKRDNHIPVQYNFSKNVLESGRLYAKNNLSLQGFKKMIRHALAKDIYVDIDMQNAGPTLISQYCHKNDIKCRALDNYVKNRNKILSKIQKFHDIDRDCAKRLMIRLCYLGSYVIEIDNSNEYEPKDKLPFVEQFKREFESIAEEICEKEAETYELVKKDKSKPNKKSSTLSITVQVLEHTCLMAMYDFFQNNGYTVGVLCFDGLMVERCEELDLEIIQLLSDCEKYVKNKTKYKITLDVKSMDVELPFELPEITNYVFSDLDCQRKIFELEGEEKFKYCDSTLYVFNEKTGMFESGNLTLINYMKKHKDKLLIETKSGRDTKEESYGESTVLMNRIPQLVYAAGKDDRWLQKTQNTSLNYLLFKNGIYNMTTGKFKKEFDPNIVFHCSIPWDYHKRDKTKVKNAMELTFNAWFDNPSPMIMALAIALAGGNPIKKFYFCPGRTNSGKSTFVKILETVFGNYIAFYNGESLAYKSSKDTKDEAANLRWAKNIRFSRMAFSNEVNMKKKFDGNAIKKHSGRDNLVGRNHCKEEVSFIPHYTLFGMFNDIPEIQPLDAAVEGRIEYITFKNVFVDEETYRKEKNDNYRIKDLEFSDTIQNEDFVQGFIHILLDAYKRYISGEEKPIFDKIEKEEWIGNDKQDLEVIEIFKDKYEITNNDEDRVTAGDIRKFRDSNKKLKTISPHNFNKMLIDKLNLKQKRTSDLKFWTGVKVKLFV
jgi:hypothetical protein